MRCKQKCYMRLLGRLFKELSWLGKRTFAFSPISLFAAWNSCVMAGAPPAILDCEVTLKIEAIYSVGRACVFDVIMKLSYQICTVCTWTSLCECHKFLIFLCNSYFAFIFKCNWPYANGNIHTSIFAFSEQSQQCPLFLFPFELYAWCGSYLKHFT